VILPLSVERLSQRELLDMAVMQLGLRLHPGTPREQILGLLRYKGPDSLLPNPINEMRAKLVAFIQLHQNQLSLPCHGDCYRHCDALVVQCYVELQRDTQLTIQLEDLMDTGNLRRPTEEDPNSDG